MNCYQVGAVSPATGGRRRGVSNPTGRCGEVAVPEALSQPADRLDGNVVPCCFDKDSEYVMGNLLEDDFAAIWNGRRYRDFRRLLNERGRTLPMCGDCTEGSGE